DGWIELNKNSFLLHNDFHQDCELVSSNAGSTIGFTFTRRFLTCDARDYAIEPGTTNFVFAVGSGKPRTLNDSSVVFDMKYNQLLQRNLPAWPIEMQDTDSLVIKANNAHVPSEVTTYWCVTVKLDEILQADKHHIIQPIVYPPEAGLPFGGPDFNPWVMVEIHYNNVEKKSGIIDESGFRLTYTKNLRPNDAAIMELGLIYSDANSIPPGRSNWAMTGECVADCTNKFPKEGITIFASQLHSHLTGRKLWTSHYRDGVKIGEINRDNHFSPHWQVIRRFQGLKKVLPGDVLSTTCVYETLDKKNWTWGGYGIEDEMCVNYIYYYPASEVEVCKSAVDNSTLHKFFSAFGVKNPKLKIHEKYLTVKWSERRYKFLNELYTSGNLNMHCLNHAGDLFPVCKKKRDINFCKKLCH
uniref:Copper type II ascorbate-dependent monooxygenase C-terminal domain-containing protein n=1 Tax=Acrobeloides nanus TaxID=290746 RepID=A0A914CZH4_9BILA